MKKVFSIAMLLMLATYVYAQQSVTRFLGIPVDGSKSEMIRQLKSKGYRSVSSDSDLLEGEFNGTQVNISVVTNNNKVCRIVVSDAHASDEKEIQIRFNKLCRQFENNDKYLSWKDQTIPDDEKISFEMLVNKKRYEAVFYQKDPKADSITINEKFIPIIHSKYSKEQLENPTEELKSEFAKLSLQFMTELYSKKPVWFMISDFYGEYQIVMYYDNEYNRANGEDL